MSAALDLKRVINDIQKRLTRSISPQQMNLIGAFVVDEIKDRSRRGFGVYEGGQEKRFPALSKSYIAARKKTRLSPYTSPSKSNITRTGKLLGSIRYTTATGRILIQPTGGRNDSNWDNAQLAEHLQTKMKRPFMSLSKKQIERLVNFLAVKIFKIL